MFHHSDWFLTNKYSQIDKKDRFVFLKLVFGSGQQDICLNNWQWVLNLLLLFWIWGIRDFVTYWCYLSSSWSGWNRIEMWEISTSGKDWLLTITRCCTDYYFLRKSEVKVTIDTDELCEGFGFFWYCTFIVSGCKFERIWIYLPGKNNWL